MWSLSEDSCRGWPPSAISILWEIEISVADARDFHGQLRGLLASILVPIGRADARSRRPDRLVGGDLSDALPLEAERTLVLREAAAGWLGRARAHRRCRAIGNL